MNVIVAVRHNAAIIGYAPRHEVLRAHAARFGIKDAAGGLEEVLEVVNGAFAGLRGVGGGHLIHHVVVLLAQHRLVNALRRGFPGEVRLDERCATIRVGVGSARDYIVVVLPRLPIAVGINRGVEAQANLAARVLRKVAQQVDVKLSSEDGVHVVFGIGALIQNHEIARQAIREQGSVDLLGDLHAHLVGFRVVGENLITAENLVLRNEGDHLAVKSGAVFLQVVLSVLFALGVPLVQAERLMDGALIVLVQIRDAQDVARCASPRTVAQVSSLKLNFSLKDDLRRIGGANKEGVVSQGNARRVNAQVGVYVDVRLNGAAVRGGLLHAEGGRLLKLKRRLLGGGLHKGEGIRRIRRTELRLHGERGVSRRRQAVLRRRNGACRIGKRQVDGAISVGDDGRIGSVARCGQLNSGCARLVRRELERAQAQRLMRGGACRVDGSKLLISQARHIEGQQTLRVERGVRRGDNAHLLRIRRVIRNVNIQQPGCPAALFAAISPDGKHGNIRVCRGGNARDNRCGVNGALRLAHDGLGVVQGHIRGAIAHALREQAVKQAAFAVAFALRALSACACGLSSLSGLLVSLCRCLCSRFGLRLRYRLSRRRERTNVPRKRKSRLHALRDVAHQGQLKGRQVAFSRQARARGGAQLLGLLLRQTVIAQDDSAADARRQVFFVQLQIRAVMILPRRPASRHFLGKQRRTGTGFLAAVKLPLLFGERLQQLALLAHVDVRGAQQKNHVVAIGGATQLAALKRSGKVAQADGNLHALIVEQERAILVIRNARSRNSRANVLGKVLFASSDAGQHLFGRGQIVGQQLSQSLSQLLIGHIKGRKRGIGVSLGVCFAGVARLGVSGIAGGGFCARGARGGGVGVSGVSGVRFVGRSSG